MIAPIIDIEKAEIVCGAVRRRKRPQAIFIDDNACGFRIKPAEKTQGNELFLEEFLMVADSSVDASHLCEVWNETVINRELEK